MKHTRLAAAAALLAPAVIFLSACGGSDSSPSSSSQPAPAATTGRTNSGLDVAPTVSLASTPPGVATTPSTSGTSTATAKLNLNTSTGADYKRVIPNFPDRMVNEFLEYKPYVSIQQFRREIGKYVGASQVAEYEKYVYVPVKPNDADADTLKQLPRVDDAVASRLVASRPFASNDAFLAKLAELAPGVDLNQAKSLLG